MLSETVRIDTGDAMLHGDLVLPEHPRALVAFAHGSGSSRHSPRNRAVAGELHRAGLGTLLPDLLTEDEERRDVVTAEHRFDIALLGRRMVAVVDWLVAHPATAAPARFGLGLFGASTGAAAALVAAAERPDRIRAVVSRGGRPDLAGAALERVAAPVLMVVGGEDRGVLRLNQRAAARLRAPHEIRVIPDAGHLFEEPGTLEAVAAAARDWFAHEIARAPARGTGGGAGP